MSKLTNIELVQIWEDMCPETRLLWNNSLSKFLKDYEKHRTNMEDNR